MAIIHCALLHGTFAPESEWKNPGSFFRNSLSNEMQLLGHKVEFHEVKWSGGNSDSGRSAAVNSAIKKIENIEINDPKDESIFVFGHSHGGNIAREVVRYADAMKHPIAGVITFNTPFFYFLKRDFPGVFRNFSSLVVLLIALAGFALIFPLIINGVYETYLEASRCTAGVISKKENSTCYIELGWRVAIIIVQLGVLGTIFFLALKLSKFISGVTDNAISYIYNRHFLEVFERKVKTRFLIFNTGGDEIYNGLSLLSGIFNIPFFIMHRLLALIYFLFWVFFGYRYTFTNAKCWVQSAVTFEPEHTSPTMDVILAPFLDFIFYLPCGGSAVLSVQYGSMFKVLEYVLYSAIFGIFILIVTYILLFTIGAIANVLFGYLAFGTRTVGTGFRQRLLSSLSYVFQRRGIDIVPLDVERIEFIDMGLSSAFLNHSALYNNIELIKTIGNWVNSTEQNKGGEK